MRSRRRQSQSSSNSDHPPVQLQPRMESYEDEVSSLDAVFSTADFIRPNWQIKLRQQGRLIGLFLILVFFVSIQAFLLPRFPAIVPGPRVLRSATSLYNKNQDFASIPLSRLQVFPYTFLPPAPKSNRMFHDGNDDRDVLVARYDEQEELGENISNPPLVHFVHTRFMQEQGNLTALGMARLYLFEIFCLPTMIHQTTSNFLWLIRIDPDLAGSVFSALYQLVKDEPNIYLVASNNNFRINENFPGAWRDGAQTADLQASRIYTGDMERLQAAAYSVDKKLVLETRLDADDGLHVGYLQTIQQLAIQELATDTNLQWKYWCARQHVEWHWTAPSMSEFSLPAGKLEPVQRTDMCITPGITVVFPVGVKEADVPIFAHHELVREAKKLPPGKRCSRDMNKDCVDFVRTLSFHAIRSRTPTSAGMMSVLMEESKSLDMEWWLEYMLWSAVYREFGLSRKQISWMQSYLTRHLKEIGLENLRGQCTTGHSCKETAKRDLERLVELAT